MPERFVNRDQSLDKNILNKEIASAPTQDVIADLQKNNAAVLERQEREKVVDLRYFEDRADQVKQTSADPAKTLKNIEAIQQIEGMHFSKLSALEVACQKLQESFIPFLNSGPCQEATHLFRQINETLHTVRLEESVLKQQHRKELNGVLSRPDVPNIHLELLANSLLERGSELYQTALKQLRAPVEQLTHLAAEQLTRLPASLSNLEQSAEQLLHRFGDAVKKLLALGATNANAPEKINLVVTPGQNRLYDPIRLKDGSHVTLAVNVTQYGDISYRASVSGVPHVSLLHEQGELHRPQNQKENLAFLITVVTDLGQEKKSITGDLNIGGGKIGVHAGSDVSLSLESGSSVKLSAMREPTEYKDNSLRQDLIFNVVYAKEPIEQTRHKAKQNVTIIRNTKIGFE